MKCPFCGDQEDKVIDSRPTEEGSAIRRRRECVKCSGRFTTYEKIENIPLMVIKKDGTRESFNKDKILNGIIKACEKRPVTADQIEKIANQVEIEIYNMMKKELRSDEIGEILMKNLKDLDEVAYVRFASVYRQFKDIDTFLEEVKKLIKDKA